MSEYKIDYCHHDSVTAESRQEYIKREDAIKGLEMLIEPVEYDEHDVIWNDGVKGCINDIKHHTPSADVVEVRHGHWILCQPNSLHLDWRDSLFECSVCRMNRIRRTGEILNYCPYCGARMDGDEE